MKNDGYQFELDFIKMINGKTFEELEDNVKRIIQYAFPLIQNNDVVTAKKYDFHAKPDVAVSVGNVTKYFSLKKGNSKVIHSEGIRTLILFLRQNNISVETQKTILYFHYGDGTLNGTGEKRYSYRYVYECLKPYILKANIELNNKSLIKSAVERFALKGSENYKTERVDYLVLNYDENLYMISKDSIMKCALEKDYGYFHTLHIGPITIRPYTRNDLREKNENKKEIVCIVLRDLKSLVIKNDVLRK